MGEHEPVLGPDSVPKLASKARLRFDRHAGKHLILYPERGLELSDTAAEIAKRCDGTRSMRRIVDELALVYGAGPESRSSVDELERDVYAFVESLRCKGLIDLG